MVGHSNANNSRIPAFIAAYIMRFQEVEVELWVARAAAHLICDCSVLHKARWTTCRPGHHFSTRRQLECDGLHTTHGFALTRYF